MPAKGFRPLPSVFKVKFSQLPPPPPPPPPPPRKNAGLP